MCTFMIEKVIFVGETIKGEMVMKTKVECVYSIYTV